MRLTIIIYLIGIVQVLAFNSYAQQTKLNLNLKNSALGTVLDEIENQTDFYFLFNQKTVDMDRIVSANFKDKSIKDVLDALFNGTQIKYLISDRQIVLSTDQPIQSSTQQGRRISGSVVDEDGIPLPGVTVLIKNTTIGIVTDVNGKFQLDVPANNNTLVFSFVGMKTQEVPLASQTTLKITMQAETIGLEEVVAIGYGVMKKSDLTGAVSSVRADRIENEKPQAVQDLLRGNIAGLSVGFSSTAKGGGDLEVRGDNTLKASSNPLIVLDGVIYQGALADVNPNDIETIDVLKDASSAAVYGARSANGVVIITTKKGASGKPLITVNSSIGLAQMATMKDVYGPYDFIDWRTDVMKSLNYYNTKTNQKLYIFNNPENLPDGVTMDMWLDGKTGDATDIWLARLGMLPVEVANYKAGKFVDWTDMVFQTGLRQDHNIALSGKKDEISYYWSVGYNKNEGIIVGDEFATIRSRVNLEAKVTDFLTVGLNSQFANRDESNINAAWGRIVDNTPWGSIYKDDGVTIRISPVDDLGRGAKHPLYDKMFQDRREFYNTFDNNLYAKIKLPLGITYQVNFTPRFEWFEYMNHRSAKHEEWTKFGGEAVREQKKKYSWQVDNLIKWNKTFNEIHQFDVTLLANAEKFQSWQNKMTTQGFQPTDALGYHNMGAGLSTSTTISSFDEYFTGDALMARLFYSLSNKYMITLSVRRDGYSAFGQMHPRGTFPSAALGWVISDENFFKNDVLTYAKLRASWGVNGNREVGMYEALSDMSTGKYPYQTLSGTVYEGTQLYVNRMANPNLKWERTQSLNIGMDYSIKNGLFDGSIEYYKSNTIDLLIDRKLSPILGFSSVAANMGEVQNQGIELSLNARIINHSAFKWNASANFSYNRNKILHLYGDMEDVLDENGNVTGQRESDDRTNKWFIGHAIDEIWEPKILGVWQLGEETEAAKYGQYPGDFKLKDVNGDSKINDLDNEFLGFRQPRFRWTMRHEFNLYKNFDISFLMYSHWGHLGSFNSAKNRDGFPERINSYKLPYWTPENPTNDYARIYSAEGGARFNVWRKRSFIRLDNVSVAYTVPSQLINKVNIKNLKFFCTVRNVGFWAPEWNFWDPEQYRNENNDLTNGPSPRIYTLGVNLTL